MDDTRKLPEIEDWKQCESDKMFWEYLNKVGKRYAERIDRKEMQVSDIPIRMIRDSCAYMGDAKLGEMLYKYEIYKKVMDLSGDIAEVGIFRGDSFLLWAKLIKLFEQHNLTQVYGFDWFEGMNPGKEDDDNQKGQYAGDYEHLLELINWLKLDNIALVQKMDVSKEIGRFCEERPFLRFKILFIDCGIKEVMEAAYEHLYPRLVRGGVLLMDHYNFKVSPSESDIIDKYIGKQVIHQMCFARQPSGFIIKE